MTTNKRLFDITTRHQVYVEGYKAGLFVDLQKTLAELSSEIQRLFSRMRKRTFEGLSKTQLAAVIVRVRETVKRVFKRYRNQLLREIEAFMFVELGLTRRQFVSFFEPPGLSYQGVASEDDALAFIPFYGQDESFVPLFGLAAITTNPASLWATLRNTPMPANGVTLVNFVNAYAASAQTQIEKTVRQAWANNLTVDETVANLTGTPGGNLGGISEGSTSQVDRIFNQGKAVIDTAGQFVSSAVVAGVASAMFNRYAWNSIIDSGTTDICLSRDGTIYSFATGPRPPAHIRCRSSISPLLDAGQAYAAASFASWLADQPKDVQDDMRGGKDASTAKPLTLSQYERKLTAILTR